MIRVEVIQDFTLQDFDKLKNIKRRAIETKGRLYKGDTFECDEEMYKYLTGKNGYNKAFVKLIEVLPKEKPIKLEDADIEVIAEAVNKAVKKTSKKKTSKK